MWQNQCNQLTYEVRIADAEHAFAELNGRLIDGEKAAAGRHQHAVAARRTTRAVGTAVGRCRWRHRRSPSRRRQHRRRGRVLYDGRRQQQAPRAEFDRLRGCLALRPRRRRAVAKSTRDKVTQDKREVRRRCSDESHNRRCERWWW